MSLNQIKGIAHFRPWTENPRVGGSIPPLATNLIRSVPVTWVTFYTVGTICILCARTGKGRIETQRQALDQYSRVNVMDLEYIPGDSDWKWVAKIFAYNVTI